MGWHAPYGGRLVCHRPYLGVAGRPADGKARKNPHTLRKGEDYRC